VGVPFPGTQIYDRWHAEYDLAGWWLDLSRVPLEPDLHNATPEDVREGLRYDPTLALDFFRYSDEVRDGIARCVAFKADHNAATVARYCQSPAG
jgi:hypothetical protein